MSGFFGTYDCFLFDLDGVLYAGDRPIPAAAEAVRASRAAGKGIAFMTNNSARTPEAVVGRLGKAGIAAAFGEIQTSASITAEALAERGIRTAYVVGEEGIFAALKVSGIETVDEGSRLPDAVVIGWDRSADYSKLRAASVFVERGAALFATNADTSFPAADGTRWPGAGAILAAIETTTGAQAEIFGKPNSPIYVAALDKAGGGAPLVIGDRLDTDIAGAVALGWDSLLVLTGISSREDLLESSVQPTFVSEDLSILTS